MDDDTLQFLIGVFTGWMSLAAVMLLIDLLSRVCG